ncbi:MAG TPA: T9SS type A sorting domain-containing protein [Puia sp.]
MKTISAQISGTSRKLLLPLALMTTTLVSYAGSPLPVPNAVTITKNLNNKKHKVKLFTASDYKTLLFTVDGVDENRYTLFVFDLDGKLIIQSVILNHETGILSELPAGDYLYEVLANDTRVENGQLTVK